MSFFDFFKGITPVQDTEEQLRIHMLWFLFIRVLLFTLLLGITYLLHSKDRLIILPPPFIILAFIFILYGYSIGSALYLQKHTLHLRRFGILQLLSDTIFIALLVYATGCSQSIFTSVFILPIIAGGLILHRIGGLIPAAAATILYGIVLTLEYLGRIPTYYFDYLYIPVEKYTVLMNIFAVYGLTFFLIAMLSGMLANRLRRAEDALSLSELKFDRLLLLYKQIFDDIITGIITVGDQGDITSFNPAAEKITGFLQAEVLGKKLSETFPQLDYEGSERNVTDLQKKDGTVIRVGFSSSDLHMSSNPQLNEPACSSCQVITLQDISQVEEMERQMRKAEKMAAIGELSASIAHDFRNPLAAISGSAQILDIELQEEKTKEEQTLQNLTRIILRESQRMADTITDFLDYARPVNPNPKWFNLNELANDAARKTAGKTKGFPNCRILIDITGDLVLYADQKLIRLLLTHLLKNSCYASRNTDKPVRVTACKKAETDDFVLEVKDEGEGFGPEILQQLTDPFFTTRDDTSGLGLSIVQQIVSNHAGTMQISGAEGAGCIVRITLPRESVNPPEQS